MAASPAERTAAETQTRPINPAVAALRHDQARGPPAAAAAAAAPTTILPVKMERSNSEVVRMEERNDLKQAAEQSLSVILDLTVAGVVRWANSSWEDVVGTPVDHIVGKNMADLLDQDKHAFSDAVEVMRKDDSKSKMVRFSIQTGPRSRLRPPISSSLPDLSPGTVIDSPDPLLPFYIDLEAQGILLYDRNSGEESHTMWMIRPAVIREVTIDLPHVLIESLGVGAEMFAQHLTRLAEVGGNDPERYPPPLPVLCRICERQMTPWWFPKHNELCLQEYRDEAELQSAQEALSEHRNAIVRTLDGLEAQTRAKQRQPGAEMHSASPPPPLPEYKGVAIGVSSSPVSPASGRASPAGGPGNRSREHSASGVPSRPRSFAVRRPPLRIVEHVLDLCDTALDINTPALKDTRGQDDELRTQSPLSESRVTQVLQWQSPGPGALESEPGLAALCEDTDHLCKAKVEAVLVFRRQLEYSERIRAEVAVLLQDCTDAALEKAAKITAGEDSSSGEDVTDSPDDQTDDEVTPAPSARQPTFPQTFETHNAMASVFRAASERSASHSPQRRLSSAISTRSSSPRGTGTSTPRLQPSALSLPSEPSLGGALSVDGDQGADSDGSLAQSSGLHRQDSLASDLSLSRARSSRERKRTSLVLPRALSSNRGSSPGRMPGQPVSPLKVTKPRLPSGSSEMSRSPITSPILPASEFSSAHILAQHRHHRRQSSVASSEVSNAPHSPRMSFSNHPQARAVPPSIKDFEVIKPISRGAFGSVYLAKKKSTGDYFAIKALKKADMVAKNQVANVKAERAIMMWQGTSDFVAKLYWTFPSKDYIFLVMEYLNGGDCASLVKALGTLPEDWAKRYIAEVVQGVDHLHQREIVHRDLKPDNLLIDQKGHLKLTDFGLSRMGLIGRQKRALNRRKDEQPMPDLLKQGPFQRSVSMGSSRSTSFDHHKAFSPAQTPILVAANTEHAAQPSYFNLTRDSSNPREPTRQSSGHQSDYGDPDPLSAAFRRFSLADEPWQPAKHSPQTEDGQIREEESTDGFPLSQTRSETSNQIGQTPPQTGVMAPPPMALFDPDDSNRRFVGTPDYLAPETINGLGQDEMSDWWSLGCILFEFLYGYPPFTAETPDKVFGNILARRIDWPPDGAYDVSEEARDLMNKLMCLDPSQRLGANIDGKYASGGDEIRRHPWFADIDWNTLNETEASFIPMSENPEDTEYFDARGAVMENFATEFDDQAISPSASPNPDFERPHDALSRVRKEWNSTKRGLMPLHIPPHVRENRSRRLSEPALADDFGQFSFKNLPVLEKANKDVIQKLRVEAMQAQSRAIQPPHTATGVTPTLEGSPVLPGSVSRTISASRGMNRPASPSLSIGTSTMNSSPSRGSQPSSPLVQFTASHFSERRKPSGGSLSSLTPALSLPSANVLSDSTRLPPSVKIPSNASSPVRLARTPAADQRLGVGELPSPRTRSQTVGASASADGESLRARLSHQRPKSQVLDISPSSSDTDDPRQKAQLLRVQRRRQSSRRLSQINILDGPIFRPLNILVCEDHPVSKMVMERLFDKLRCRTVIASDGAEAMRYACSSVKFDIVMMEFKLPQINGANVARMIRETKNANCHTPIVAVTGYLKELQAPNHFDALIEKPATMPKLTEILSRLCQWRPPPTAIEQQIPTGDDKSNISISGSPGSASQSRKDLALMDDSPTSTSSGFVAISSSSYRGSSREDSVSSASLFGDPDLKSDDVSFIVSRPSLDEWQDHPETGGLGILEHHHPARSQYHQHSSAHQPKPIHLPTLAQTSSAPADLGRQQVRRSPSAEAIQAKKEHLQRERHECAESGDDEDDELGNRARSRSPRIKPPARTASKLGVEMMRTNSQGSVISTSEHAANLPTATGDAIINPASGSSSGAVAYSSFPSENTQRPLPASPPPSIASDIIVEEHEGEAEAEAEAFRRAEKDSGSTTPSAKDSSSLIHPDDTNLLLQDSASASATTPPILFPKEPGTAITHVVDKTSSLSLTSEPQSITSGHEHGHVATAGEVALKDAVVEAVTAPAADANAEQKSA